MLKFVFIFLSISLNVFGEVPPAEHPCAPWMKMYCPGLSEKEIAHNNYLCLDWRFSSYSLKCQAFLYKAMVPSDVCLKDAFVHCPNSLNRRARFNCLLSNMPKLSSGCIGNLERNKRYDTREEAVCGPEMALHCQPHGYSRLFCLHHLLEEKKITEPCRKFLELYHPTKFSPEGLEMHRRLPLWSFCEANIGTTCPSMDHDSIVKGNYACLLNHASSLFPECRSYLTHTLRTTNPCLADTFQFCSDENPSSKPKECLLKNRAALRKECADFLDKR